MRIINLTNLEKSEIKYKISKFPDGQQNVTVQSFTDKDNEDWIGTKDCRFKTGDMKIISHLNNWMDLELIICTVACLKELGIINVHLVTPYFLGARSDRKFEAGSNWYLKQVIGPVINSLKLSSIVVLDPHSWVLGNVLNNFKYIDNEQLVKWALINIYPGFKGIVGNPDFILISPDAGASHKIQKIADKLNYKGDIITCTKERDINGKLTKTVVTNIEEYNASGKDFIIIDDICDGGRTFINIAKEIRNNIGSFYNQKIYLIVTHGIFSNGFKELSQYFDGIYCTNSYSNVGDLAGNDLEKTNTKQLNIY